MSKERRILKMIYFIVNNIEYRFERNDDLKYNDQIEQIRLDFLKTDPSFPNLWRSQSRKDCWFLFPDYLTVTTISNVTGCSRSKIITRIKGTTKGVLRLNAIKSPDDQHLVRYVDFAYYDFNIIPIKNAFLLDGKEAVIKRYLNDSLPISAISKALGVSRNTLVSYIKANNISAKPEKQERISIPLVPAINKHQKDRIVPDHLEQYRGQYKKLSKNEKITVVRRFFFEEFWPLSPIGSFLGASHLSAINLSKRHIPEIALQVRLKKEKAAIKKLFLSELTPAQIAAELKIDEKALSFFATCYLRELAEEMALGKYDSKIKKFVKHNVTLESIAHFFGVSRKGLKSYIQKRENQ